MNLEYAMAVDTETTSDGKLLCISTYDLRGGCLSSHTGGNSPLADILADPERSLVFHNAKFDIKILEANGYFIGGKVHDTYLQAKVLYEHFPSYSLDYLMYHFLGDLHVPYSTMSDWFRINGYGVDASDWKMEDLPAEILRDYAIKDAEGTFKLFWVLREGIRRNRLLKSYMIELGTIRPVIDMEKGGILIDRPWVKKYMADLSRKTSSLRAQAQKISGIEDLNLNSVRQMAEVMTREGVTFPRTEKGNLKFDKKTRAAMTHPLIEIKNAVSDNQKIIKTYCENLFQATDNSRSMAWPNFQQSFAATRRFSSRGVAGSNVKLNWQNLPEQMMRAILVPKGMAGWYFDYKGIENVLHIFFSEDKARRKAYEDDEDWSEYLWLSEKIMGKRITKEHPRYKGIKSTKLGMNYGLGWRKYASMNGLSLEEAKASFDQVSAACPAIKLLQDKVASQLMKQGHVRDPFGYIYHGPARMAYKVVAYMIQGCAAALMKCAIARVHEIDGVTARLTIHDSIYFTTRDNKQQWELARQAQLAMTDFSYLFDGLPIRVDTFRSVTTWSDKKRVNL